MRPGVGAPQRGAVLVETALILPLLLLLLVGLGELGVAWRIDNEATRSLRATMLQAARSSTNREADLNILESTRSSLGSAEDLRWVIVYRTTAGSPDPPAACVTLAEALSGGSDGIDDTCNAYHGTFVRSASSSDFLDPDCAGDPDRWLCPSDRRDLFATSDRLGVAFRFHHSWYVGILPGSGITIDDHAVTPLLTGLGDLE